MMRPDLHFMTNLGWGRVRLGFPSVTVTAVPGHPKVISCLSILFMPTPLTVQLCLTLESALFRPFFFDHTMYTT